MISLYVCVFQVVTCPNASFTDLAEIVSRIEPVKPVLVDGKATDTHSNIFTCIHSVWEKIHCYLLSSIFGFFPEFALISF